MEIYEGVKFETVVVRDRAPVWAGASELLDWCRLFVEHGLASAGEDASGNLSVRLDQGFLVTPTHVPLDRLEPEDLVHVLGVEEERRVLVQGRLAPSSETLMHAALYEARPEIGAVFHGHAEEIVSRGASLGLKATAREAPYGTMELARLAVDAATDAEVFLLLRHGFVALGRTMEDAGEEALRALARIRAARLP